MYMGDLGQGSTGSRFRIIAERGRRAVCPRGTSRESGGRLGTRQEYVWCHRAPQFAPPARTTVTYEAPRTTVSPAIQAQISPQISPAMAQQQASPGASVTSAPMQQAEMLRRIEAADKVRQAEFESLRREMAERAELSRQVRQAEMQAASDREIARQEAAEAAAQEAERSAVALPPIGVSIPPSFPTLPDFPGPVVASTLPPSFDAGSTIVAPRDESKVPLLLIAAAAAGAALLLRGKPGKQFRIAKP